MAFKVGDAIVLKISGPKMLIEEISGSSCSCVWFDVAHPTAKPVRDEFDEALRRA